MQIKTDTFTSKLTSVSSGTSSNRINFRDRVVIRDTSETWIDPSSSLHTQINNFNVKYIFEYNRR